MGTITAEWIDTGEKRDATGRKMTPKERRKHFVQAYQNSGMTMAAFARREKLNYATFAGWLSRAQREGASKSPIKFAELRMPISAPSASSDDVLEVRLVDGTAVRGSRVADVVALIRALRS